MEENLRLYVKDFHLDHIFDCGQAFRWEKETDGSYTGIAGSHAANLQFTQQEGGAPGEGTLLISEETGGVGEESRLFWEKYLDLHRSYGEIKETLEKTGDVMKRAIQYGYGIRLLQQDKWETILSFLISQNNHIPRIKKCIRLLCENFGEKAGICRGRVYYSVPQPETLAALKPEELEVCRLGYRAKYLIETARQVVEDGLEKLEQMGGEGVAYEEAFQYITRFCGVGPKVANCILLFSMGQYASFPIDVWVKKVMKELYGLETPGQMKEFAQKNFGQYSGFAQQYLFYYIRSR